ncbi:ATP-binding protein [Nonomuraea angiospora]|uniref:ATP-binding protein n=1 Tax=Nonomuraea angiospora TaxID=46172 RepID=UPI00344B25B5
MSTTWPDCAATASGSSASEHRPILTPASPSPIVEQALLRPARLQYSARGRRSRRESRNRQSGRWQNVTMRTPRAKYFNTTGPCDPQRHYMLPPTQRLPQARALIDMDRFFVLHAPRQTGKTTALRTLASELTADGDIAALMFSCEEAKVAGDDVGWAESLLLDSIRDAAARSGWPKELRPPSQWPHSSPGSRLRAALREWCRPCPRRMVLFLDEIDALQGNSMISILSQLRAGHNARPEGHPFPTSVVLCGLRDLRDYKVASGGEPGRSNPASPFNIVAESLRLGDFTADQIAELYGQHTEATGQAFTKDSVDRVFELTQGQPWLVNALAYEVTFNMGVTGAITAEQVEEAKERLIRKRATHLDALVARLHEPRVERVIEPIVAGTWPDTDTAFDDDVSYVHDLGLIRGTRDLEIANPIYREVLLRVLGDRTERFVKADPYSFVMPDGHFDLRRLLREFVVFWREHGEVLILQEGYHEAACQIILMAFLHRLVNGGGYLDREYAAGTKRLDVLVRWPYTGPKGERLMQREAMELKVWRAGENDPSPDDLAQLDRYLDRLSLDTGVLVVFDRRPEAPPWKERGGFEQATTPSGREVTVLRV